MGLRNRCSIMVWTLVVNLFGINMVIGFLCLIVGVDFNLYMGKLFNQTWHRVMSNGCSTDEIQLYDEVQTGVYKMTWAESGDCMQPKSNGVTL